ncbi:MAG TPA: carboxypeptidase-like regulatory domain-containing protein [Acidobacteriaceae bacterium]|nr:carboxypeptidase-like regulatory domain-containing protein [Acidobacteriaceae bacterium]
MRAASLRTRLRGARCILRVACFLALAVIVMIPSLLLAQSSMGTSSVGGTVLDASKLPIAGTAIHLEDTRHGTTRATVTDNHGSYLFTGVLPGIYTVRAEQKGFATSVINNVQVVIDQSATVNLVLQVGTVSQSVQVNAEGATPLLDTTSNALGTVVDNARVEQLPLNGRNFLQLGLLAAGSQRPTGSSDMVSSQTGRGDTSISVAGSNQFQTSYLIDGIATRGSRIGNSSLNLSLAAIDQFKIELGFFMPDQGPNPGIVDVITKSGTNKLHGEAYDFVRNTDLNATNFFATKPQILHRNQFGFAIGGPIIIPKLVNGQNKLWFHFTYEGTRQIQNFLSSAYTPTQAMMNGDFSGESSSITIYNPYTYDPNTGKRAAFAGNIIPSSMINPIAKQLLTYYLPGANYSETPSNLFGYPRNTFNDDQFTVRVDNAISARQSIFATVSHENSPVVSGSLMPLAGASYPLIADLAVLQHTLTLGPHAINIARVGLDRAIVSSQGQAESGPALETQIGIPGTPDPHGIPGISIQGFSGFGRSSGVIGNRDDSYELDDALDYTRGSHNLAFGVGIHYHRTVQQNANANAVGTLSFQPIFSAQLAPGSSGPTPVKNTGSALADFLLGMPLSGTVVGFRPMHYRYAEFFPYVQDSWHAARNLTINYGISWYYSQVPNPEGADRQIPHAFNFSTGLLEYAGLGQVAPQIIHPDRNNFTPRLGFVWQPNFWHNGVVRGGAGIYYGQMGLLEAQFGAVAPPFQNAVPFTNNQFSPMPTNTFGNGVFPVVPAQPLTDTYAANLASGFAPFAVNPNSVTPYVSQWTFSLQQTFGANDLLEVDYLGNSGHHQQNRYDADQCQVSTSLFCDKNKRPFPHYAYILYSNTDGNMSYEGLSIKYEHHLSKGLTVLAHYTYSKTLSDSWETAAGTVNQIASCRSCDKGPTSYDMPQQMVMSALYDLPFGRGRTFGRTLPRVPDMVLGGWRLGTIGTLSSGTAFTITSPNATGSPFTQVRANRLCNGKDSAFSSHLRSNGYVDFNPACFASPAAGYFGTSPRGVLFGPGTVNWDMSMAKQIQLVEQMHLEMRGEFFNVFNHANFGLPNSNTGSVTFGKVSSAGDPRLIQISARLVW